MTMLLGVIILAGALLSLVLKRTREARLLQAFGWWPFLFFSVFGNYPEDVPAFWWSDMSVVPFIILLSSLVSTLADQFQGKTSIPLSGSDLCSLCVSAIQLARTTDNAFVPAFLRPPQSVIDRAFRRQRFRSAQNPQVDHVVISRLSSWCLPVSRAYTRNFGGYLAELEGQVDSRQGDLRQIEMEKGRIEHRVRRFGVCGL
jgi:hypothetical protein